MEVIAGANLMSHMLTRCCEVEPYSWSAATQWALPGVAAAIAPCREAHGPGQHQDAGKEHGVQVVQAAVKNLSYMLIVSCEFEPCSWSIATHWAWPGMATAML